MTGDHSHILPAAIGIERIVVLTRLGSEQRAGVVGLLRAPLEEPTIPVFILRLHALRQQLLFTAVLCASRPEAAPPAAA